MSILVTIILYVSGTVPTNCGHSWYHPWTSNGRYVVQCNAQDSVVDTYHVSNLNGGKNYHYAVYTNDHGVIRRATWTAQQAQAIFGPKNMKRPY